MGRHRDGRDEDRAQLLLRPVRVQRVELPQLRYRGASGNTKDAWKIRFILHMNTDITRLHLQPKLVKIQIPFSQSVLFAIIGEI